MFRSFPHLVLFPIFALGAHFRILFVSWRKESNPMFCTTLTSSSLPFFLPFNVLSTGESKRQVTALYAHSSILLLSTRTLSPQSPFPQSAFSEKLLHSSFVIQRHRSLTFGEKLSRRLPYSIPSLTKFVWRLILSRLIK